MCTYSYEWRWTNRKYNSTDMNMVMSFAGWRARGASTRASGRTSCAWCPPAASRGSCTRSCGLCSRPNSLLRPLRAPLVLPQLLLRLRRPRTATRRTRCLPPIRPPAHRSPPVLLLLRALPTPTCRRWLKQSRRDNSHTSNRGLCWVSCEIVNSFAHSRSFLLLPYAMFFGVQYFYRELFYTLLCMSIVCTGV